MPQICPITITPLSADTVEAVAALEKACFTTPWSPKALREELDNPMAVFFTAQIDGQVAGYAGMHHVVDEGYIANIAVDAAYRRMGVASALLEAFFSYARTHALTLLTLEVRAGNTAAQQLYQKYGFVENGRRRDYYRHPTEDALLLCRTFTPDSAENNNQV